MPLRKVITENEAQTLELYLERAEINKRFKIVPMHVLKEVIQKGIDKGLTITTISESVGLAFVTVYHQYKKMNSDEKDCQKNPHKYEISKDDLMEAIKLMKSRSKIELSAVLQRKFGYFISYSTVTRLLISHGVEL